MVLCGCLINTHILIVSLAS